MTATFLNWIETPLALALGRTLTHFVWEGAAIAALLAATLYTGARSSRLRYGLAVAALLAMPLAFGVTLAICAPAGSTATVVRFSRTARTLAIQQVPADSQPADSPDAASWLVPLWIAGVLVCYLRICAGWLGALRLRRRGVCAAPEAWQARVNQLAERLRVSRPVVLLESCLADVPVVIGWFRPVILVPLDLLAGLPTGQVEAILIHELAHIRRYDYAVNLLQGFVEGLLFYHPAVWWISHVVRAERENCCDDMVVAHCADTRAYVAALAALEQNRTITGEAVLAATGGNLMKRIHRLLEEPSPTHRSRTHRSVAPAIAVGLLLIAAAGSMQAVSASLTMVNAGRIARIAVAPAAAAPSQSAADSRTAVNANRIARFAATPAPAVLRTAALPQDQKQQERQQADRVSTPYRKWLNEDVAYIITKEERTQFLDLKTDADRDHFIEQFWLRRDPTPGTPANEFKDEHYRRIAYANERFSETIPGWKTDRGRIYIMYGPPDEIDAFPNGGYKRPAEEGGQLVAYPLQRWAYRYIEGLGKNVVVEFDDLKSNGQYRLGPGPVL
jgi:GWxTD domain-containing protein